MALIEKHGDMLNGEPHVKGRRISVRQIVQMVHGDHSPEDVAEQFHLDIDKVNAALKYYRLNRDEIEEHMNEELKLVEETEADNNAPAS